MVDGTADAGDEKPQELSTKEQEETFKRYIAENQEFEGLAIAIEDDTTDGVWAGFYAEVSAEYKKRVAWFEEIKKPLNALLAVVRAKEHQACDRPKEVLDAITKARGAWMQRKLDDVAAKNKAAIQEAQESGSGVAILETKPTQTVHTSSGASVGLAKQPSWRLTDNQYITAKTIRNEKIEYNRTEPMLKNVPDKAFILDTGLVMSLLKSGDIPAGEHSIEKFDDFKSTSK